MGHRRGTHRHAHISFTVLVLQNSTSNNIVSKFDRSYQQKMRISKDIQQTTTPSYKIEHESDLEAALPNNRMLEILIVVAVVAVVLIGLFVLRKVPSKNKQNNDYNDNNY